MITTLDEFGHGKELFWGSINVIENLDWYKTYQADYRNWYLLDISKSALDSSNIIDRNAEFVEFLKESIDDIPNSYLILCTMDMGELWRSAAHMILAMKCGIDRDHIVYVTSSGRDILPYCKNVYLPGLWINTTTHSNYGIPASSIEYYEERGLEIGPSQPVSNYFVCVMRAARANRIIFANMILDRFPEKDFKMMCSTFTYSEITNRDHLHELFVFEKYRDKFPYTFSDGVDTESFPEWDYIPVTNIGKSMINLVIESSGDVPSVMSEKSFKPFAWFQIPIFFAPPTHYLEMEKLGFDLFKDIIDYAELDTIYRPNEKMMKILELIDHFKRRYPTIELLNVLKRKLRPRLLHNFHMLKEAQVIVNKEFNEKMIELL